MNKLFLSSLFITAIAISFPSCFSQSVTGSSSSGVFSSLSSSSTGSEPVDDDSIRPSSHSECLSFPDPKSIYSVKACPIYSGNQKLFPPVLANEKVLIDIESFHQINTQYLTFPVTIYGIISNRIRLDYTGLIMFGNDPELYPFADRPIPDNGLAQGSGPAIYSLQGYNFINPSSKVSTGLIGNAPNSIFVIRYHRITANGMRDASPPRFFSFDVFLFENSTTFEIRYYQLDLPDSTITPFPTSVGVQGNNDARYVALFSRSMNFTSVNSALLGNILSFTPINTATSTATSVNDNSPSSNNNNSNNNDNLSDGAIAGIVIGSVIGGILLAVLLIMNIFTNRRLSVLNEKLLRNEKVMAEMKQPGSNQIFSSKPPAISSAYNRPDMEVTQAHDVEMGSM